MLIVVLDDVVTDLRPVKNCAGRDVCRWIFDDLKHSGNGDTATRVGNDAELGDADKLLQDNNVASRNFNVSNDRDRNALVDVDRSHGRDDWIAHSGSSLAQANANDVVGRTRVCDDLAEVKRAGVNIRDDAIGGGVDLLTRGECFFVGRVFRNIKDAFNRNRSEGISLEITFRDSNQITLNDDRTDRHINVGCEVDLFSVVNELGLHGTPGLRRADMVKHRWRRSLAGDLYSGTVVLTVHTEVDVTAEAHAQRVGRHFDSFNHRSATTIEEHNLERRQDIRIGE